MTTRSIRQDTTIGLEEKGGNVTHLETHLAAGLEVQDAQFLHDFPKDKHTKVFRKVDIRLMPMLMALYLVSNLDRCVILIRMTSLTTDSRYYTEPTLATPKLKAWKRTSR
jgi:hypothetical protein